MKFSVSHLGRPLFESALIVFSVLLALYVNRWAENQRTEEQKRVALERIAKELENNQALMKDAHQVHKRILINLEKASLDENDSLRIYLAHQKYFDEKITGFLTNGNPFYRQFPSSTSWNAAEATGIVAEFDYGVV